MRHIFFCDIKRKCGARQKKTVWRKTAQTRLFCLNTGVSRIHAQHNFGLCRVRYTLQTEQRLTRKQHCAEKSGSLPKTPASLSAAAPAVFNAWGSFQRRGSQALPLAALRGCGGNRRSTASGGYNEAVSRNPAKRCRWQSKRAGFEAGPRFADAKRPQTGMAQR